MPIIRVIILPSEEETVLSKEWQQQIRATRKHQKKTEIVIMPYENTTHRTRSIAYCIEGVIATKITAKKQILVEFWNGE